MSTGHSHKPLSTPIRGINLDRFSSFAPQEYPNKFGIPFGLSSVVRLPVAVPSGLLTQPLRFNGLVPLQVIFFYILEITVSVDLEFSGCQFIAYDDAMLVSLECGEGA